MKKLSKIYLALVFLFLYAPIFVLIVFSFNTTKSKTVFEGFTLDWYIKLFNNKLILTSLRNTIIIAVIASVFSTIFGEGRRVAAGERAVHADAVVCVLFGTNEL